MKMNSTAQCHRKLGNRLVAGSWSAFAAVIVIAMAILVNLIAGGLPSTSTQIDLTGNSMYSLTNQTKQIAASLDRDVQLILLATTGSEDETITRFLNRYTELSGHIRTETVDPGQNPSFLKNYELDTSRLYQNSVIVQCGEKYRLVGYNDIYVTNYTPNYQTQSYDTTTVFSGENAITNAIHYVSNDHLPKVYMLNGHGEQPVSDELLGLIKKDNMQVETISLLSADSIPDDASAVMINAPTSDLSADEAQLLITYLLNGGNVLLTTDYIPEGKMEHLLSVTKAMGLTVQPGIIIEGDQNRRIAKYPHYLLPEMAEHETTAALKKAGYYILTPVAQPLLQTEDQKASVTWLLSTSSSSFAKSAALNMKSTAREDGDTDGPFHVGAISSSKGKLIWFTSRDMMSDQADRVVSGGNSNLLLNVINWSSNHEERISIRPKSMDEERLTVPAGASGLWSIVMIGLIPATLIIVGTIICIRRKRR